MDGIIEGRVWLAIPSIVETHFLCQLDHQFQRFAIFGPTLCRPLGIIWVLASYVGLVRPGQAEVSWAKLGRAGA